MPEQQEEKKKIDDLKSSKILDFFSSSVKEAKKEKVKPLTKIVIRRLPPRLTKETFLAEFELPDHDYFYFVRGDLSMGQNSFAQAYVNFKTTEDIFAFKEKFDDYLLQDDKGREYNAVVEWAPVQRISKKFSQKKAPQAGTIESDQRYIEFLEKLEKEKNSVTNSSGYFMETEGVPTKEAKVTTTPLLEFLKVRKQQKLELKLKRREAEKERRRKEDEVRKVEKLKKVKEKKIEDKIESTQEPKDGDKPKSDGPGEAKEKKPENKTTKNEKTDFMVKSRVFEKREKTSRKEIAENSSRPRNQSDLKPKKDPEVKKSQKTSHKTTGNETESIKTSEGNRPVKKEDGDLRKDAKSKFRYSEQRNRERADKPHKKEDKAPVEKGESERRHEARRIRRQSTQETSDGSVEGDDKNGDSRSGRNSKDPRTERRIRNKDRPTMQIYRPGMGRFSKQRIEQKKDDDASDSDDKRSENVREGRKTYKSVKQSSFTKDGDVDDKPDSPAADEPKIVNEPAEAAADEAEVDAEADL